jgi:hypothetical protein
MDFSLKSKELRWVVCFGILVMLFTTIPYAFGFFKQDSDWTFSGALVNVEDINTYFANMVSGSAGSWLFQTPYSAYPQPRIIIFLPYILLGKLAAPPNLHLKITLLYHGFRFLAGLLAIIATYDFLSVFIQKTRWRRYGTIICSLGGGLGWLIPFLGSQGWLQSMPIEYYSPEAFGFLMIFCLPHLALARAFLLWGLKSYIKAWQLHGMSFVYSSLKMGLFWLLSALSQPLTGLVAGAIPVSHLLVTGILDIFRRIKGHKQEEKLWIHQLYSILLGGIIAGPFAIYNILLFKTNPFLDSWSNQSLIPSASPLLYLFAYSLIIPLSVYGGIQLLRKDFRQGLFLVQWVIIFICAIYIPFSLQRRLNEGVWIGLVAFAMIAFESFSDRTATKLTFKFLSHSILSFTMISTIIFMIGMFRFGFDRPQPVFIPGTGGKAFEYLSTHAKKDELVLASYETGNALPSWAPLRVVMGINTLSMDIYHMREEVKDFYSQENSDAQRVEFLNSFGVNYVFWGPQESMLGQWNPNSSLFLKKIYQQGGYSIFEYIAGRD